jgi:hypothetical protein
VLTAVSRYGRFNFRHRSASAIVAEDCQSCKHAAIPAPTFLHYTCCKIPAERVKTHARNGLGEVVSPSRSN